MSSKRAGWWLARAWSTRTFARSLFGFRQLAEPRQYFGVRFQTQLLGVRREDIRYYVRHRNCVLTAWREALEHLRSLPAFGI